MKKGLLVTVLVAVVVGGAIFGFLRYLDSILAQPVRDFQSAIQSEDYEKAYGYLAQAVQKKYELDTLKVHPYFQAFKDYPKLSWGSLNIKNNQGSLLGSLENSKEEKIPLHVTFVKEQEQWKIISINIEVGFKSKGTLIAKEERVVPTLEELKSRVTVLFQDFMQDHKSNQLKNFRKNYMNLYYQKKYNEENFYKYFLPKEGETSVAELYDIIAKDNISIVNIPEIRNQKGYVSYDVEGYFTNGGKSLNFSLGYIYEDLEWRLYRIRYKLNAFKE